MSSTESFPDGWQATHGEPGSQELPYPYAETVTAGETGDPDGDEWEREMESRRTFKQPDKDIIVHNAMQRGEIIDAAAELDLFKDVAITEGEEGHEFVVPPRLLQTSSAIRQLAVSGYVKWFKTQSDYGDLRFLAGGEGGWIPHLYPFEETDDKCLPIFLDRERASVRAKLTRMRGRSIGPDELLLQTRQGAFRGEMSSEEWYAHQGDDSIVSFDTYTAIGRALYAARVKHSRFDFEIEEQNDWPGEHTGSVWVPMDLLRAGVVDARVTFPDFAENGKQV